MLRTDTQSRGWLNAQTIATDSLKHHGNIVSHILATILPRSASATSADVSRCSYRPKSARVGKRRDATIVIAERLAQHVFGMFAEQGRGDGVDDRRQAEMDRRFDIGDRACGWMRYLAEAMALAYFRRVERLLDGPKITDGDAGRLHFHHPILAIVLHENSGE